MEKTIGMRIRECRVKLRMKQDEDISSEVMQMAMAFQQIQNKELRRVADEQVKILARYTGINI